MNNRESVIIVTCWFSISKWVSILWWSCMEVSNKIPKCNFIENLFFDKFSLPEGAEFYAYNADESLLLGPVTRQKFDVSR